VISRYWIRIPAAAVVVLKMFFCLSLFVQAEQVAVPTEVEIAKLRIKLYQHQEYPLQRRLLNSKIKVARVRVESLERQREEYQQFTKFKYSAPMFAELERIAVQLTEAEENLKNLIEEKLLLERFYQDRLRLMQLELQLLERSLAQQSGN